MSKQESRPEVGAASQSIVPERDLQSTTAVAHKLSQRGLHVFPVDHPAQPKCIGKHHHCDGSRGKHPAVTWGTWAATNTPQMIDREWERRRGIANIGIACGPSDLVVLDEDEPGELDRWCAAHGFDLPDTYTVNTGRGRHLYYRWDHATKSIGNTPKAVDGYKIDIRGDGGYVVAEGSQHASGAVYTGNGASIADLADDVAHYLLAFQRGAEHREPIPAEDTGPHREHNGVIRYHDRHNGLVSYAGRLRSKGLTFAEALPVFKQRWLDCEQPTGQITEARYHNADVPHPVTWVEAQQKLSDVYGRYPAGDPSDADTHADAGENSDPNVTHSGHLGMAVKLAKRFRSTLLYVHPIGWHHWDGKRWAPDADGAARRAVHSIIKHERVKLGSLPVEDRLKRAKEIARFETASAITGILTEAAVLTELSVPVSEVDADPWLFNCANGTLDLHTMELRGHDPADRITKVARGAYLPGVKSQQWETFNTTVLPNADVRTYWQRLLSLSLLGKVTGDKQILPIATGEGANGKTTAIEAISFAMGDYAQPAEPELLMARRHQDAHPTGIADLRGKRLVTISESKQDRRLDIPTMKRLTGGDTLKARFMRKDFFEFDPSHLLVMHTNHLPRVDDDTEAVWRRIRAIPFTVQIPEDERDDQLGDRLQLDADAVLTWLIDGWSAYRERGLQTPDAVLNETNRYKAESDAVGRFIADECLVGGAQSSATTGQLYERWQRWAARENVPELTKIAFGRTLDRKGFPADQTTKGWRRPGICLQIDDQVW